MHASPVSSMSIHLTEYRNLHANEHKKKEITKSGREIHSLAW